MKIEWLMGDERRTLRIDGKIVSLEIFDKIYPLLRRIEREAEDLKSE